MTQHSLSQKSVYSKETQHNLRRWLQQSFSQLCALVIALTFFLSCICNNQALAQDPFFYIEISPKSGTLDDTFMMSVVVEGNYENVYPVLVGGDDFKLNLIGPRSEVQIINGRVKSKITYNYKLIPQHEGVLDSPSAEIEVNGQKFAAPALKIQVRASNSQGQLESASPVFLRQSLTTNSLYEGQQAVNTFELYSRVKLIQPQFEDLTYEDFWNQPLGKEAHFQRVVDGKRYDVIQIKRAIFPLKSGTLTLPTRRIQAKIAVQTNRRSNFDDMDPFADSLFPGFLGTMSYEDKSIRSNEMPIEVKALPQTPADYDYKALVSDWGLNTAIVGSTRLSATIAPGDIDLGASKTLTLVVSSYGNLSSLNSLALDLGADVRLYPEAPESASVEKDDFLVSQKTFRVSILPTAAGEITVPAIKLGYFNPVEGRWEIAETKALSFKVIDKNASSNTLSQNQKTAAVQTPAQKKQTAETDKTKEALKEDSQPAQSAMAEKSEQASATAPTPSSSNEIQYREETLLEKASHQISTGLALLIIAIICVLLFFVSKILHLQGNSQATQKSLRAIENAANIDALHLIIQQTVASSLKVSPNSEGESLKALIRQHIIDQGQQYALLNLLDEIESQRFGPKQNQNNNIDALKQRALQTLKAII